MNLMLSILWYILLDTVVAEEWPFAGVNIARGKRTSQTPGTLNGMVSGLAVDGNTNNDPRQGSCSHTTGVTNAKATWTVYLNGSYTLKGIRVFNRFNLRERIMNFKIIGLPYFTELHNDAVSNPPLYNKPHIDVAIDSAEQFSSITIEVPGNDRRKTWLTLCEVQIYSENHDCSMPYSSGALVTTVREGTGYLNSAKALVSTLTVLDFKCSGYYTLNGSHSITCLPGGVYNAPEPTCFEIQCDMPPSIANGYYVRSVPERYSVGDIVTWRCEQGYKSEQNHTRQCLASSDWSGEEPVCVRITCSFPGQILNGYLQVGENEKYTSGNLESGTIVNVFCTEGFKANSLHINCKEDGQWDVEPVCVLIECPKPEKLVGGYYVYMSNNPVETRKEDVYEYGTTANAICNETLFKVSNESDVERMCSQDGSWTGNDDLCVSLCERPLIPNGYLENQEDAEFYEAGQSVTPVCRKGFELNDQLQTTITCQENHTWDMPIPSCTDTQTEEQRASCAGEIAGGVFGGVVVGVMACIAVVWLMWKRKQLSKQQKPSSVYTKPNLAFSSSVDGEHTYADIGQT